MIKQIDIVVTVACDCKCGRGCKTVQFESTNASIAYGAPLFFEDGLREAGWECIAGDHYCPDCKECS
jgi:hypothetical protein